MATLAVRRFRAMNTDVEVRARDILSGSLLSTAEETFASIERRFSRFVNDSELSRLNRREIDRVSPAMFELLSLARRLHEETGGIFDPSVLPVLTAWGYDRSFQFVGDAPDDPPTVATCSSTFGDVVMRRETCQVLLPEGMQIDLGGIGKGWAVDCVAAGMSHLRDVQINAGGDQYARGHCGDGDGWPASIIHPLSGETVSVVRLRGQALATSSTAVRRWRRGRVTAHHLIDPRSQMPAASGVTAVSVIAGTAVRADVYAKCALLLGLESGREFLTAHNCPGLFVLDDGRMDATDDWPAPTASIQGE